jgi:hypothetical protein
MVVEGLLVHLAIQGLQEQLATQAQLEIQEPMV